MKIEGKKAWLRILEAFIAILLISGVLLLIFVKQSKKPDIEDEIRNIQKVILGEISKNNDMRTAVLEAQNNTIENFISSRMPPTLNFTILICDINSVCGLPHLRETYTKKDIYTQETIISSTLEKYQPRKLKLFVWRK